MRARRRTIESVIHDHRAGSVLVGALLIAVAALGVIGPIAKRPPSPSTTAITGILFATFLWSGSVARGAERLVFLLAAVAMAVPLAIGIARPSGAAVYTIGSVISSSSFAAIAGVIGQRLIAGSRRRSE